MEFCNTLYIYQLHKHMRVGIMIKYTATAPRSMPYIIIRGEETHTEPCHVGRF